MVPLLVLIGATLGTILAGLATPTEAAGIGTVGALLLALIYRKLHLAGLQRALNSTMADLQHGAAAGGHLQHLRRGVRRLGTANWITNTLLSFQLPPMLMLCWCWC